MATRPLPPGPVGKAAGIDPTSRTRAATEVAPAEAVKATDEAAAVERAAAATAAAPVAASTAVGRATAADRIANIADRLRRGVLTPAQAVEELIEDTVKNSLPGSTADSRLSQELRALLQSYIKDDPTLAAKIGRLGVDS